MIFKVLIDYENAIKNLWHDSIEKWNDTILENTATRVT